MLVQVVIESKGRAERRLIDVTTGILTIGRAPTCTLPIESALISRTHVSVDMNGHRMRVTDSSTNGTLAGDRFVRGSSTDVPFGVPIVLGDHTVWLETSDPSIAKTVESASEKALKPTMPAPMPVNSRGLTLQGSRPAGEALARPNGADPSNERAAERAEERTRHENVELRREIHKLLINHLDLATVEASKIEDPSLRPKVLNALRRIVRSLDGRMPEGTNRDALVGELTDEALGLGRSPLTLEKLIEFGSLTPQIGTFLTRSVIAKKNIVVAGRAGSGKTTLLNVLSAAIPPDERIVTIEDAAELQLRQPNVVSLETRPANMEGSGESTIRDLVRNALRMRPDRIVVGECRGGEALDMLQAMHTGHDGSLTTTHANSPREAVSRLETLVLMAGIELPVRAIRELVAGSLHVLVQQSRLSDGSRKVTAISEIVGIDESGEIAIVPIFEFHRTGTGPQGKVLGAFRATGFLPTFLDDFIVRGLVGPGEAYL